MKKQSSIIAAGLMLMAGCLASCTNDLNRLPTNTTTGTVAFSTPAGAEDALAKAYGAYTVTSSNGPDNSDLGGLDNGTSDFIRLLWDANELSTDEAVCAWNDPGVPDFHNMQWTAGDVILLGLYSRSLYQITVCNSFLQQAAAADLSQYSAQDKQNLQYYEAECRFLRAYQYWILMDNFANPPFVTEKDPIGAFVPPQISRDSLFSYIQSELSAIDPLMVKPRQNDYGRADEACVWALKARMYINAGVYLGAANAAPYYDSAITYASQVIGAGYSLMPVYGHLFLADNNLNNPEQILSIPYDGENTQTYGGTTFIINGAVGGSMSPAAYGVPGGGWDGNRVTSNVPALFNEVAVTDPRGMFYTSGQSLVIQNIGVFTDGYAVTKWQNVNSDGTIPAGASTFCNTDFPLFRLAEMYLIYAEAVLRGGTTGTMTQALAYFNDLRDRAFGPGVADVTSIALPDILNERGREFYWECQRRDDLIRFGEFTSGSYLWPWKGGVPSGTGVDSHYNIFPIPSTDLTANPNLIQNPDY